MPPIYEYSCTGCGEQSTQFRKIDQRDQQSFCRCGRVVVRVFSAPHVMPDIAPYQTVAADKETGKLVDIRSRKDHREFLKRNGYEELGSQDYWGHKEHDRERRDRLASRTKS
jgi:putative FmdB family regulatory protein